MNEPMTHGAHKSYMKAREKYAAENNPQNSYRYHTI